MGSMETVLELHLLSNLSEENSLLTQYPRSRILLLYLQSI